MKVNKDELLRSLPDEWQEDLLPEIQTLVEKSGTKIVVVDDDPTGTQTIYNVPVLTEWSQESLTTVLSEQGVLFYILANSRSLPLSQAQTLNREIAVNLQSASKASGRDFVVVSRSDSTLRGHYPGEVIALMEGLEQTFDGVLIIPFFLEGGRLTIDDVHYVAEGEWLIPAAETEYAKDASFGYKNSNLRAWVNEKHRGKLQAEDTSSISIDALRQGGPEAVATALSRINWRQVCVVNAVTYRDMEVFVAGLLRAEAAGKRFIYRTAASFVRVRAGLRPRSLLNSADLAISADKHGGLIVAGSYIKKSTTQIEAVKSLPSVASLEVAVERLLDASSREDEIQRVADAGNQSLATGQDTLIYTSRRLITGRDESSSLEIGQTVSAALIEIVDRLSERPRWIIAKGGITSSDIATKALKVRRADVLGQAIPGIPIWRTDGASRWPGLIYVVFPGNVGGPEAIAEMIQILRGCQTSFSQV